MAMTTCKKCGEQISPDTAACPHCGKRLGLSTQFIWALGCGSAGLMTLFVLVMVVVGAWVGFNTASGMVRARLSANEAEAAGLMRTIASAQRAFQADGVVDVDADGVGDYGTLQELASHKDDVGVPYLDAELATGTLAGYSFEVTVEHGVADTSPGYTCVAKPVSPGASGHREYFVDESGVIRVTADGSAVGPASTPM